jgi:hypothetical protein
MTPPPVKSSIRISLWRLYLFHWIIYWIFLRIAPWSKLVKPFSNTDPCVHTREIPHELDIMDLQWPCRTARSKVSFTSASELRRKVSLQYEILPAQLKSVYNSLWNYYKLAFCFSETSHGSSTDPLASKWNRTSNITRVSYTRTVEHSAHTDSGHGMCEIRSWEYVRGNGKDS